jgi:hypothetical protein
MIKLVWKKKSGFGMTYNGYSNDVKLFSVSWDVCSQRGSPNPWRLSSYLPGIETVHGGSSGELMMKAAELLREWIKRIGIEAKIE